MVCYKESKILALIHSAHKSGAETFENADNLALLHTLVG